MRRGVSTHQLTSEWCADYFNRAPQPQLDCVERPEWDKLCPHTDGFWDEDILRMDGDAAHKIKEESYRGWEVESLSVDICKRQFISN
jgi:hypothetical protein